MSDKKIDSQIPKETDKYTKLINEIAENAKNIPKMPLQYFMKKYAYLDLDEDEFGYLYRIDGNMNDIDNLIGFYDLVNDKEDLDKLLVEHNEVDGKQTTDIRLGKKQYEKLIMMSDMSEDVKKDLKEGRKPDTEQYIGKYTKIYSKFKNLFYDILSDKDINAFTVMKYFTIQRIFFIFPEDSESVRNRKKDQTDKYIAILEYWYCGIRDNLVNVRRDIMKQKRL